MKAIEVFGIIVRTFGLSLLIYALWYLAYGLASVVGFEAGDPSELKAYFLTGGVQLLSGIYLLRGAPGVVNFAYAERQEKPPVKADDPGDW